ncbi:MAG: hypothetical protein R3350_02295 [Saprospiraceae bacterium]|nr:hypothetical protein [Saprospiraceae bacterium]
MKMPILLRSSLTLIATLLLLPLTWSQDAEATQSKSDAPSWFEMLPETDENSIKLTVFTDIKKLIKDKYKEEYQSGTVEYVSPEGEPVKLDLKLRSRGNVRKEVCYYPPVKLNFVAGDLDSLGLNPEHDKYKLVIQCRKGDNYKAVTLKEKLAYEIYNLFTPISFRVKPIDILFKDTRGKAKDLELEGFIIETEEELAERNNGVMVERGSANFFMTEDYPTVLMSTFQYLIGNTDWSIYNLHNLKLIKVPEYDKVLVVPYDFDYAGLVGATYAVPHESLPIASVRERLYVGPEFTDEQMEKITALMKEKEEDIMALVDSVPLDEREQKYTRSFLEDFFDMLTDSERLAAAMKR